MIGKLRTNTRMLILLCAFLLSFTKAPELPKKDASSWSIAPTGFAQKVALHFTTSPFRKIKSRKGKYPVSTFAEKPTLTMTTMDTIPSGSFIIDMGVEPQTIANALKPYGLIWHLVQLYETPVKWSIDPNKAKDGTDFSYNGTDFKGGPFIVSAEYRTTEVDSVIQAWEAQGVVGQTTSSEITVPIYTTLSSSIKWSLDQQNGTLAEPYFANAGIPTSAYDWVQPPDLGCCNDIFVLPHADPSWSTHGNLLVWNDSEANGGCAGTIWAGCRAVGNLENIFNPSNTSERLNFLMADPVPPATTSAFTYLEHDDGTLPPPYLYDYPAEPIMQFLGELDGATANGSEEIYFPKEGGWRSTTKIGVWDDDHNQVPSLSPGPAAILAFGYAFGDTTRGMVMYEAGHRLNKLNNPDNIAAQRAFFNFSFLATGLKAISVATDVPAALQLGQSYNFTGTVSGGSGGYSYEWTSDCPGNFTSTNTLSTTFTPDSVSTTTECIIQLKVTDSCGSRFGFSTVSVTISAVPTAPVASDDFVNTDINTSVSIAVLANDSDSNLNMDSSSLSLNGVLQATHGTTIVKDTIYEIGYAPDINFTGVDSFQYVICDGLALCDTAMVKINVFCQGTPGQNTISGTVFFDADLDGEFDDEEGGDQSISVRLRQDLNKNGAIDTEDVVTDSTQTASDGTYSFIVTPSFSNSSNLSQRIIESSDDAMEKQGNIMELLNKNEVKFKSERPYNGLRFQNITVPQGVTITNAYLEFTAKDTKTGSLTSTIYGEKTNSSVTFSTQSGDISDRTLTDSLVTWNLPDMTLNLTYQTPDLSPVIQEIIDQANWSSGNNTITLIITTSDATENERKLKSYDFSHSEAPLLVINYEESDSAEYAYLIDLNEDSLSENHFFTTSAVHTALFTQPGQTDCNNNFGIEEPEICDNGKDDDDDGLIDCNDPDCSNYNDAGTISGDETACGSFDPSPINNATAPTGSGSGSVSYSWQKSTDGETTWIDISGDTLESYDPGPISQTTHYRRGVRRYSCDPWLYTNSAIKTVNENYTDGGTISGDELVCNPFDPATITETLPPSGGTGSIQYQWQDSTATGNWADIIGAVSSTFNPSPISVTTYYRRGARSEGCSSFVISNIATKTVSSMPTLVDDSIMAGCPGLAYSDNVALNDSGFSNPVFSIVSSPANGTVAIQNNGSFTYTPTNPVCGTEQFTYRVCNDNSNCCDTATVALDLTDNVIPALSNIPADITINCDDDIPLPAQVQVWENCTSISMDITEVSTQGADSCALYSYVLTRTWTVTDFCGNNSSGSQNITLEDKTAPSIYRIYTLPNGKKLIAGVMENVTQRWKTILFPIHFKVDPLVFAQLVSINEGSAAVARMRNISTSQFQLRLQEEENNDGLHLEEKVAWIAIEEGSQMVGQALEAGKVSAGSNATALTFNQSYSQPPAFIESIQTYFEPDPVALRYENLSGTGTTIYLEEETSRDIETEHVNETVAYLAIGALGNLLDQSGEIIGETGTIAVTNNLLTIPFSNQFHHPVVVLGGSSRSETDPTSIRVTNVTNSNFQVQLQEWDYEDGTHAAENLSYLIIEGSIPFDKTVECSAIPEAPVLGTDLIAVDNCDASVEITVTENSNSFNCASDTLFTRTWSVTDECGNTATFTRTFTLQDTTPPNFSLPPDLTITCPDDRNDLQITGDVLDENDNCTISLQAVYTDDSTNVSNCLGTINRIWSLTDNCGNSTSKTQIITLEQSISGVVLDIKVMLSGALLENGGDTLMRDDLRANNRLPQLEPYTAIPFFHHFGEGGLETCSQGVLDITGSDAIVDWIMIELRNPYMPDSIVASRSALLQRDGDVVDVDGTSLLSFHLVPTAEYYIAVRHRNHLGIMSATPYLLSPTATIVDFTDSTTNVFGENSRVNLNGKMALWAGDLNGDKKVIYQGPANDIFLIFIFTMLDTSNTSLLANHIGLGYDLADLNLDGRIIYQGPNNDRSKMLFYNILKSPENNQQLANFILNEKLP